MAKISNLHSIYSDLRNTQKSFQSIAQENNLSLATIYNINNGKTHKDPSQDYPLRRLGVYQPDIAAWVYHHQHEFKLQHLAVIAGINYQTALKYATEDRPYIPLPALDHKLNLMRRLITPNKEIIHATGDINLTYNDVLYLRFLYTFNKDRTAVLFTLKNWLDIEFPFMRRPIADTYDSLASYLEWGGTKSKILWYASGIIEGRIKYYKALDGQCLPIDWKLFPIDQLRPQFVDSEWIEISDLIKLLKQNLD